VTARDIALTKKINIMSRRHQNIMFFIIGLLSSQALVAQFNIKVGYAGGWIQDNEINEIIRRFNVGIGSKLEDKMDEFSSLHGLELGLRYRRNRMGVELSWHSLSGNSDFVGTVITQTQTFPSVTDKWFMSQNEYTLGLENYYGQWGYGASFGLTDIRMRTSITGSARKRRLVMDESIPTGKLYLIYQYPGEKVGIAFKPYVKIPLQSINVGVFETDLMRTYIPDFQVINSPDTRWLTYGVSIVLYNGAQ
jgi:hypothetical protein